MTKKEKALLACEALEKIYPDVECSLNFTKPYELMIATRLSAQCTDARVNIVTETLFKKYPPWNPLPKLIYQSLRKS